MTEFDYIPRDENLVFTFDDVREGLIKLGFDDQEQALDILDMANVLSSKLPNVSVESALTILAEIGVQPNKIKKLKEIMRDG